MATTIRKYIKYIVVCLSVVGLWTEEDKIFGTKYYWIYHIFVNVLCAGLLNLAQFLYLVSVTNDLEKLTSSAYLFMTCVMASVKTYFFCQHFALFKSIMSRLDQENFQPRNERQRRRVHEFMKVHIVFQVFFLVCYCLGMTFWILSPIVLSKEATLPFRAWYPFDEHRSSTLFILVYIHQSVGMSLIALTNTLVDLVTVGLIAYVAVECDILSDVLENLHGFTKERLEFEGRPNVQDSKVREEMNGTLLNCVRFHWKILRLARDTNKILNIYTFVLFANSLLAICMTMFRMNIVGFGSREISILGVFQASVFNELLMYCWFGNQLIAKSNRLDCAVYESDWVDCPRVFKENMAFFMLRTSQRPIRMFGVNFFALSLGTFINILRGSWSFCTMLNQLRRKNE